MKIARLALAFTLFGSTATLAFADGVDPLAGIKKGGGSTPITITNPNPIVTGTMVQDSGDGKTCTIAGDTCLQDVFQNRLGTTLTSLTIFVTSPSNLTFACNEEETDIFAKCQVNPVNGGFDFFFSGGSVASATLTCVPDGDLDDLTVLVFGCPNKFLNADDYKWVGGEFAFDIEGTLTDGVPDAPAGTTITTQVITSPEPGSASMLLFGMLAFGLLKVARRTV